jgi:hypothetical protein
MLYMPDISETLGHHASECKAIGSELGVEVETCRFSGVGPWAVRSIESADAFCHAESQRLI